MRWRGVEVTREIGGVHEAPSVYRGNKMVCTKQLGGGGRGEGEGRGRRGVEVGVQCADKRRRGGTKEVEAELD
ncbi:hypothetical protein PMAC_001350 [Pneumocystis sp. 'macacae']|nr:hypothetical protein PMAC_001350 [Pneumocystis sp. 'macacae']